MMVYISSPSSWTIWKDIQQFWESFSLHFLSLVLTSVEFVGSWMLRQAWEQFFSKGPLLKNLHSTQELQNKQPQLTSAGAEALSPGFGYSWALPKHRQGYWGSPLPPCPLCAHHSHVSATGRRAAWAFLAEGGLVPSRALAAVAVAGPTEAAHVSAGIEAALRRLLALAGAALISRQALACPAVALPACCRGRSFRSCRQPGHPPSAHAWRASPTPRSPHHPQGGPPGWCPSSPKPSQLGLWHKKAASPWALNSSQPWKCCPRRITWAAAEGAVEELAVLVVALAVGAVDVLARHVAGVAHALPAHAVPLPRADHRAVVPPAAVLQLLAGLSFGVTLAVLPCVS